MYDITVKLIDGLPREPYRHGVGAWDGVCMHDTECRGDSDESEDVYFVANWKSRQAFVHAFCDPDSITQTADWAYKSWGCGNGNSRFINIELCNGGAFKPAYDRWIWLAASKLFERKLGVIDGVTLVSHAWVSEHLGGTDHRDPIGYLAANGKTWANVVNDVLYLYNCMTQWAHQPAPTPPPKIVTPSTYKPEIVKQRVYASGGKLIRCDGNYKIPATDVRLLKLDVKRIHMRFVYERGATVSSLVRKYHADYGFNFPFFWKGVTCGDAEDHDVVISSAYGFQLKWHEFAWINGSPVIGQVDVAAPGQDFVVQASPMLIEDGKLVYAYYSWLEHTAPDIADSRAQRTFIGIDGNGNFLLACADGRTKWDRGLTVEEMALFMQSHGAVQALNGDGGSSTILATPTGGVNQSENTGVNERAVNHAMLVYLA